MYKILVTGATGFVGKSLVPALQSAGYDVLCAVSKKVDWLKANQIVVGRIESVRDWSAFLEGVDIIIHLAAKVHVMKNNVSVDEFCAVNSIATKNLAEQAARCGVKRFIFLSSIKVNGEVTLPNRPFTEEISTKPEDPYGQSKFLAEQNLQEISKTTKMELVILRPSLIFGPGVKANFLKMLQLVDKGWPLPFKAVHNKRSFIFIDNLISAISLVVHEPRAANQTYLVADDDSWSLSELLSSLASKMNIKLRLFSIPGLLIFLKLLGLTSLSNRLFGSLEVSNAKIKSQLDWTPPITSAEGLNRTVKWYQNEYNP